MGTIEANRLNVRVYPSRNAAIAGVVKAGAIVNVKSFEKNNWIKISCRSIEGYVRNRTKYIKLHKLKKKSVIKHHKINQKKTASSNIESEINTKTMQAKKINADILKQKNEIYKSKLKEKEILKDLNKADKELNETRKQVKKIKREIEDIELKLVENGNETRKITETIRKNKKYINKRVVSLYKMSRIGKMHLLASADSIYDFFLRKNAMKIILGKDDEILSAHLKNKARLNFLDEDLKNIKQSKLFLKRNLKIKLETLAVNKRKKKHLLKLIQTKRSLGFAMLEELKDAAIALNQTIQALDQGFIRKPSEKSSKKFINYKGFINMPVHGKITSIFGKAEDSKFHVKTFHSGIRIKADRGEPVQAVYSGTVLFSDWLRGYGNIIIIDHGDNYYSLYANTEEVFKNKGDKVGTGEVIATVGETGSRQGAGLHFEIRHKGVPLDPVKWFRQ